MNKLYSVHDHWTDIDKKNDVDIESIGGVITGIKVNGENYGGGGSSDFSTAEVTIVNERPETFNVHGCFKIEENITPPPDPLLPPLVSPAESTGIAFIEAQTTVIMNIILYKGRTLLDIFDANYNRVIPTATTGDIEVDAPNIIITGDCSVTISTNPQ